MPVVRFDGAGIGTLHPARRLVAGVLVGAAILLSAGCSTGSPTPTGTRSPVASPAPPADVLPTVPAGTPSPAESDDGPAAVVPTVQDLVDVLLTERDMQVGTGLQEWTSGGSTGAGSAPGAVTESNEAPSFGCAEQGALDQPAWQAYTILGATEALPVVVTETLFASQTGEVKEAFERLQGDLLAKCLGPGASDDMWITSGATFELPALGDDRFALVHRMVLDSPEVTATAEWLTRFVVIQKGAVLAVIKVTELLQGQAIGSTEDDVIRIAEAAVAKLP